jgi:membrane-associated phospholipid phosphatase
MESVWERFKEKLALPHHLTFPCQYHSFANPNYMKHLICLFALLISAGTNSMFAQSPYQLDWKKEIAITSLGLGGLGSAVYLNNRTQVFQPRQILDLRSSRLNSLDKIATSTYSLKADKTSDCFLLGSNFLPLTLLADKRIRKDFATILTMGAETMLISNGLTGLSKTGIQRTRPYVYNGSVALDAKLTKNARYSFISGHTSQVAAMSFFTAKVYVDYYPDSDWKPVVWAAAAAVPAVTGYLRVKAGKHYPTDVMAGYAVGALTGILVPQLHKKLRIKNEKVKLNVGMSGADLTVTF